MQQANVWIEIAAGFLLVLRFLSCENTVPFSVYQAIDLSQALAPLVLPCAQLTNELPHLRIPRHAKERNAGYFNLPRQAKIDQRIQVALDRSRPFVDEVRQVIIRHQDIGVLVEKEHHGPSAIEDADPTEDLFQPDTQSLEKDGLNERLVIEQG